MREFIVSFLLVGLITFGGHGFFVEVPADDTPVFVMMGTGGLGVEYELADSNPVSFRPGISLGDNGFQPSFSMGYSFRDSGFRLRMGLFDAAPYFGVSFEL